MKVEHIQSLQNPLVKRLKELQTKKGRESAGRFLIEGEHLVEEALLSKMEVVTLLYDEGKGLPATVNRALEAFPYPVKCLSTTDAVLSKLSETKTPQGIVAEVKMRSNDWATEWKCLQKYDFLILILDELQDPGNVGTIMRTAEAAGVDAVLMGRGSVDLYNGKVLRSTMGSFFRMPVFTCDVKAVSEQIKMAGGRILVTALGQQSREYDEPVYSGKVAIVIGNEARGVSDSVLSQADELIHIPIYGRTESLNAAVATGVMLYEAVRQRKADCNCG
ncbi:RNA methyltransferase [Brevibacillus laterosporus]|uniref:TrmH family RNA methyltransferase n=1 Tax=Brevibacillus laterosporus TaxID=1465 RepID=UPI0018CCA265|nr:RNA methyltransferase [Brevibacillus laterosporus]MBG9796377.1 RNA methyltransferase [Brevibacillus laterosporus]MCR8937390.1 RNA methyltransferase [Brevibacillus laterosporus]MCZ0840029.1 RNA methyltransferase [Brevibacillus laterosporus]MCZ0843401.1 RNA methyltransferase [Brevibacillus laterosporus]MED1910051.1 RNA methyltransferase [Brevibacillus laterosporus]